MMPAVSISMPAYNVAPWLSRALDSICSQTFEDWECICIDDGSTDESGAILDAYAARDSRFRVVHQKNGGGNLARQMALSLSTGQWIASIDGDDWVTPCFLQNLYSAAQSSSADVIISDFFTDENGESRRSRQCFEGNAVQFQESMLKDGGLWGATWNKLYSHDFLMRHGVSHLGSPRIYICEDLCFNVAVAAANPRVVYADCCDYHYCIREGSALKSAFNTARFYSGVRVNDWLMKYAMTDFARALVELRKKELKASAYSIKTISDEDFFSVYPEVRDLEGFKVPIWHRLLYWMAVRGLRGVIVRMIGLIRRIRSGLFQR